MKIVEIPVEGYETVVRAEDAKAGFRVMVAIHSTVLGPALGGMRMWDYSSEEEAQTDVLRLARGMTYKSAIARTGMGGGKAVILGDARKDKSDELFFFVGKVIESLGGQYITAEDVGIDVYDVDLVAQQTKHVTGRAREVGGSGDPSPYTALGTSRAISASLKRATGSGELEGRVVAVQGLGHVGYWLAKQLHQAGAKLLVSDLYEQRLTRAQDEFGATLVPADEIIRSECDVLAPCALGAVLDDVSIPALQCKVVCGAANNQLAEPRHGPALRERGILYAPDYVVNAGGIINISVELEPTGYDEAVARQRVEAVPEALAEIFAYSDQHQVSTSEAANAVAESLLAAAGRRAAAP